MEGKTDLELFNELFALVSAKGTPISPGRAWQRDSMICIDDKDQAVQVILIEPFMQAISDGKTVNIRIHPRDESDPLLRMHEIFISNIDDYQALRQNRAPSPMQSAQNDPSTRPVPPQ